MPSGLRHGRENMSESSSPKRAPFISCHNCRSRKVKCTGERPACSNCEKRDLQCSYDVHVRRRGPDKLPGGRLRNRAKPPLPLPPASAGSSPSRGAGMATQQLVVEDSDHLPPLTMPSLATLRAGNPTYHHPYGRSPPHQEITLPSISALVETSTAAAERRHLSHVARRDHGELWSDHSPLYDPPGDIDHARDGWWSWILSAYPGGRAQRQQTVIDNIKYFFQEGYLFHNFFNRRTFFRSMFSADARLSLAPHVVLAMLAQVTLSRDVHDPMSGLQSLLFAEEARNIVEYCLNSGSRDPTLAQAALVLGVYEMLPNPRHSQERSEAAQLLIDACVRACLSHTLDADASGRIREIPDQDVEMYDTSRRSIEAVSRSPDAPYEVAVNKRLDKWASLPAWAAEWSLAEIQKEEMRRMYWSASAQGASSTAWRIVHGQTPLRLATMAPPDDFAIFFPGEAYHQLNSSPIEARNTACALYYRAVSLYMIVAGQLDRLDRSRRFEIVRQVEGIEQALEVSNPMGNYYVWQAKNWTLAIRVRLRAIIWRQVDEWFQTQISILQAFARPPPGLPTFTDRPLYIFWYLLQGSLALQMASTARSYWAETDQLLSLVYEAVEAILRRWFCPSAERTLADLRSRHQEFASLRLTQGNRNASLTGACYPLI